MEDTTAVIDVHRAAPVKQHDARHVAGVAKDARARAHAAAREEHRMRDAEDLAVAAQSLWAKGALVEQQRHHHDVVLSFRCQCCRYLVEHAGVEVAGGSPRGAHIKHDHLAGKGRERPLASPRVRCRR